HRQCLDREDPIRPHAKGRGRGALLRHLRKEAWGVHMDQTPLVEGQITEGQKLIDRLIEEGVPVRAAAWVTESDSGRWYLYLVTPLVSDEGGKGPAYLRIREVRQTMPESVWIGPFQIKV